MEPTKQETAVESKPVNETENETPSSPRKSQVSNSVSFQSSGSLKDIKKSSITQIKCMKAPPQLVKELVDAVIILLRGQETDWSKAVQILSEPSIMKTFDAFDPKTIKPETLEKLKPYVENPDFTHEKVLTVCSACAPLLDWVLEVYTNATDSPIVHRERESKKEHEPKSPRASNPKSPRATSGNSRMSAGNLRKSTTPRQSVSVCDECAQLKDMVVKLTQSLLVKDEEIQRLRKLTTDKDLVTTTDSVQIEA